MAVSNPAVRIVFCPERSGTLHDPVRLKRRSPFEPPDLPRQRVSRYHEHVNVIRHEHPRREIISPCGGPFTQNSYSDAGHFGFCQPAWPGRRRVQQSVPCGEGRPTGSPKIGHNRQRQRPRQSPRNEVSGSVRLPVWKPSAHSASIPCGLGTRLESRMVFPHRGAIARLTRPQTKLSAASVLPFPL